MADISNFKQLRVWQDAMDLAEIIYATSRSFPKEETYGLTAQIKRAAISVPSNIAEGSTRGGNKELIQFLYIAKASLAELETQWLLAQRLAFIDKDPVVEDKVNKIGRSLTKLIQSLREG